MDGESRNGWDPQRESDGKEQKQIKRNYYFLCEGKNTEPFYFKALDAVKGRLGFAGTVNIRVWDKGRKIITDGRQLYEYSVRAKKDRKFVEGVDTMVIVFDGDKYEAEKQGYEELVEDIEREDIAAVSNPNFELFLILHYENAYEDYIADPDGEIFPDEPGVSYDYFIRKLKDEKLLDSKRDERCVGDLAERVFVEIEQEKKIHHDAHGIKGKVSCNI